MRTIILLLWIALMVGFVTPARATDNKDLHDLYTRLRCPVCENESIATSNAQIAGDMRHYVAKMAEQGKTDDDIIAFMRNRYGDDILMEPPLTGQTYLLWIMPALFMAAGIFVMIRIFGHKAGERKT